MAIEAFQPGGNVPDRNASKRATLAVVIPVHDGKKYLAANLESLRAQTRPPDLIVVVDNHSSDGSADLARRACPEAAVESLPQNVGFGRACNHGIRIALAREADHVLLLNQDTVLEPDACEAALKCLSGHPEIGYLALFQLRYDGAGIDPVFRKFLPQAWFDDIYLSREKAVYDAEFVPAAAAVLTRRALKEVGGFDPLFFMYKEDRDLCRRLREKKFTILISTAARVRHVCGQVHAERDWQWDLNWAYSDFLFHLKWSPHRWPFPFLTLGKYFINPPAARVFAARLVALARCLGQLRTIGRHRAGNPAEFTDSSRSTTRSESPHREPSPPRPDLAAAHAGESGLAP